MYIIIDIYCFLNGKTQRKPHNTACRLNEHSKLFNRNFDKLQHTILPAICELL